jgi:hypothetical protein
VALWGSWINDENTLTFTRGRPERKDVVLYTHRAADTPWRLATAAPAGLTLAATGGTLTAAGAYEERLTLSYDGRGDGGTLRLDCGGAAVPLHVAALPAPPADAAPLVERDRLVTIPAIAGEPGGWQSIPGLGSLGASLRAPLSLAASAPPARYRFTTVTDSDAQLRIIGLPTHPVDPGHGLRISVRIDDAAPVTLDLQTRGRSDQWRRNVLSNTSVATLTLPAFAAGTHRLEIAPLDPGVMLDRIEIVLDRARPRYGAVR